MKNKKMSKKKKIEIEDLAAMIAKGFSEMATKDEVDALIKKLRKDLNTRIDQLEETLINKMNEQRGDLIIIDRKQEKKTDCLISILKKKQNFLTSTDLKRLAKMHVFPTIKISL